MDPASQYVTSLAEEVYKKIKEDLGNVPDHDIIKTCFTDRLSDKRFLDYEIYYFNTVNNEKYYFETNNYFREFRQKYSLRGIGGEFINKLEARKKDLLSLIHEDKLTDLYLHFKTEQKHYGSFFSKFAHTFKPNSYCPIDTQMKNYFGLERESYFITMIAVSRGCKKWAEENKDRMSKMRRLVVESTDQLLLQEGQISDMKLLNTVFWSKANESIVKYE